MERISVKSSNVATIGYNLEEELLEVEFTNGSIYQYLRVPYFIYTELLSANSHGKYLSQHIKGVFTYRQVK